MTSPARSWLVAAVVALALVATWAAWRYHTRPPYAGAARDAAFWRRHLASPETRTRARAFRELTRRGDTESVDTIRHALRTDESGFVRAAAAECLGRLRDPKHVPPLAAALGDADSRVSDAATQALGKTGGPDALTALASAIDLKTPHRTVMIAVALPSFQSHRAEAELIKLLDARSAWIRWHAIVALERVGTQTCLPRLRQLQGNPLQETDYDPPKFAKHDLRATVAKLLERSIQAASERPPWPDAPPGKGGEE